MESAKGARVITMSTAVMLLPPNVVRVFIIQSDFTVSGVSRVITVTLRSAKKMIVNRVPVLSQSPATTLPMAANQSRKPVNTDLRVIDNGYPIILRYAAIVF